MYKQLTQNPLWSFSGMARTVGAPVVGVLVGVAVGAVGVEVGVLVGMADGCAEGAAEGAALGAAEGAADGTTVGLHVEHILSQSCWWMTVLQSRVPALSIDTHELASTASPCMHWPTVCAVAPTVITTSATRLVDAYRADEDVML